MNIFIILLTLHLQFAAVTDVLEIKIQTTLFDYTHGIQQ